MFVKHKCLCPHKVQITGLFSKSVTIQAKTLGLTSAFVEKKYIYIYKKWVLMGLYYIYCSQYGNYRQIYWHENSIKKKLVRECMQIICFRLQRIGKCVKQSKTRAVIFVSTERHEKHTHDFKHVEYFLSANFLWNPSSSWIEVSEPIRNKCDHHWWHIRPNNINVYWKPRVLHRYKIS